MVDRELFVLHQDNQRPAVMSFCLGSVCLVTQPMIGRHLQFGCIVFSKYGSSDFGGLDVLHSTNTAQWTLVVCFVVPQAWAAGLYVHTPGLLNMVSNKVEIVCDYTRKNVGALYVPQCLIFLLFGVPLY